jgi:hypothetical protein
VRRRGVKVEVVLLDVLAVIALAACQAEEPFLEDRVLAISQGERKADGLMAVADAADAILPPAIRSRAGVIVREVVPGVPFGL